MNTLRKSKHLINSTIDLYKDTGWKKIFARMRFWYAPFTKIEQLTPQNGTIVDLGCGEGILVNFLGMCSDKRTVIGIEVDENRIKIAPKGSKNVSFIAADITKHNLPDADCFIIFHVLHHLSSYEAQSAVLKECRDKLKKNGKIIIVEVKVQFSIKYLLTWFTDHFLVAWFFEKRIYTPILFRKVPDWESLLKNLGFTYTVHSEDKKGPFSNIIFECSSSGR